MEEAGRIEADADAAGRTGSDDVAREEGRALGNGVDQFRDSEDKFTGRTILTDFVIDLGNDVERIRSGIAQEDIRPDGAEGIQALAVEPLDVVGLQVPGRDVVEDSETVDVVHGFADGDVRTFLADDDGQFAFIVDLRCDVRMGVDEVIRADDRRRSLGEDDRIFWRFRHGCLVKFGNVFRIVLADTENIPFHMGDRGHDAYRIERFGLDGARLFVLFQRIGQGQQAVVALTDEFQHRFRKGRKESFFQGNSPVDPVFRFIQDAPLDEPEVFKSDKFFYHHKNSTPLLMITYYSMTTKE